MTRPRTVLITGSSTGIGETAALRLVREGWRVFAGVRREEHGQRLVAAAGDALEWVRLDVTDAMGIAAAARQVEARLAGRPLDGLVNNAGIAVGGPLEYVPLENVRHQFEVNVFGLLAVTQAFLPMLRRGPGRIVNVGSIAGRVTSPLVGPYCASKHAVEAITDALRLELHRWGIFTAVVEPGMVVTPIWDKASRSLDLAEGRLPQEALDRYGAGMLVMRKVTNRAKRVGTSPERVADAILHALSARRPRPRYVVGTDARVRLLLKAMLPTRWMDALVHRMVRKASAPE